MNSVVFLTRDERVGCDKNDGFLDIYECPVNLAKIIQDEDNEGFYLICIMDANSKKMITVFNPWFHKELDCFADDKYRSICEQLIQRIFNCLPKGDNCVYANIPEYIKELCDKDVWQDSQAS